mgnify:CR=1 FL=1
MKFEVFKAFPPDRDAPVVELHAAFDNGVSVPLQLRWEQGELWAVIFAPEGGVAWEFKFDDLIDGLRRASDAMR